METSQLPSMGARDSASRLAEEVAVYDMVN